MPVTALASVTPLFASSLALSDVEASSGGLSGDIRLYSPSRMLAGVVSLCGPSSDRAELPPEPPTTRYTPTPIAATTATAPMIRPVFFLPPPGAGGCA